MQEAPELRSAAEPASEAWRANEVAHLALVEELRGKLAAAALGGGERARARHTARGKLLPRDRVDTLLDPGSPFLELSPLAATGLSDGDAAAAGLITGVGRVAARGAPGPGRASPAGAPPPRASSPGSAGSPGASASSWPTTPPSRAAPTTR